MSGCEEEAAAVSYGRSQILNELKIEILEAFCEECPHRGAQHSPEKSNCKVSQILKMIDEKRGL